MLENIYKAVLERMPWPTWLVAPDSKLLFVNQSYEETFGIKLIDIKNKTYDEYLPQELAELYYSDLEACISCEATYKSSKYVESKFLECTMFAIRGEDEDIVAVAGIVMDMTENKEYQKALKDQRGILRTIIDALPEVIFYKDQESKYIGYNKSFEDFYRQRGVQEIIGKTDLEIYSDPKVAAQFIALDEEVITSKETRYFEQHIIQEDGKIKIEENMKIPVIGNDGDVWGVVGLSRDITEKKMIEQKLRHMSEIDAMTGLYNRHGFEEKIKQYNKEEFMPLGIIMGDVDGLKLVNDTLGHLEGDELLKNIANILKKSCDHKGHVFRWGGDEFIILLPNCSEVICERMMESIVEACKENESIFIQLSISLGQSLKYTVEEEAYEAIRKAEEKVYRQKLLDKKSVKGSLLEALRQGLEEKNMETHEHATRVMNSAVAIGVKLGFQKADIDELVLTAQLHDIGKISIPEDILMKETPLTKDEFEVIKTHAEKGYRIINACSELNNVAKYVLTHHERWDGTGYPLGLKGEEIPLIARIISIVDAYDVMTHDRAYKKAKSKEEAIEELKRESGSQFDPSITKAFIACVIDDKEDKE